MAYKFTVTIEYPEGLSSHAEYISWMKEQLGAEMESFQSALNDDNTPTGFKLNRWDEMGSIHSIRHYLDEDRANAMRAMLMTSLAPLGDSVVIGEVEEESQEDFDAL